MITIGASMTADTRPKDTANTGPIMAKDITGHGNPTTEDITMTGGAITVVTVDTETDSLLITPIRDMRKQTGESAWDERSAVFAGWMPRIVRKKKLDILAFLTYIGTRWRDE